MSEIRFFGKNLDHREESLAKLSLDQIRLERKKAVPSEIEKTETENHFVELINRYINEELEQFELPPLTKISPEQYHFVEANDFLEMSANEYREPNIETVRASTDQMLKSINVNRTHPVFRISSSALFTAMLHEGIHMMSHEKYWLDKKNKKMSNYRVGYGVTKHSGGGIGTPRLVGLDEAVAEKISQEITEKHKNELMSLFHISSQEAWEKQLDIAYDLEVRLLEFLLLRISIKNDEPVESVWSRFKKAEFTGELMHLRDVDKAFGKGSLKVLAKMGSQDDPEDEVIVKIVDYFVCKDPTKKNKIAQEILGK